MFVLWRCSINHLVWTWDTIYYQYHTVYDFTSHIAIACHLLRELSKISGLKYVYMSSNASKERELRRTDCSPVNQVKKKHHWSLSKIVAAKYSLNDFPLIWIKLLLKCCRAWRLSLKSKNDVVWAGLRIGINAVLLLLLNLLGNSGKWLRGYRHTMASKGQTEAH